MKYLQILDLFPEKISLTHKGEKEVRNLFSIIVSILVLCGMLAMFIIFGQNFYNRKNPAVLFKNTPTSDYPFFTLNHSNFFIGAALGDYSRKVVKPDESSYKVIFRLTEHLIEDGKDIWNVKDLESALCRETLIHPLFKELDAKNKILEGFFCPKDLNITIGGDVSQLREMWLSVNLFECDNANSALKQKPCLSKNESRAFFFNKHLLTYSLNNYIDIDSFADSIKPQVSYSAKYVSYDLFQGTNKIYQSLHVETDEGLVFESMRNEDSLIFKEEINNISIYPSETPWARNLVQNLFKISNSVTEYKRKYVKAQELAADIGGILQVLLISGSVVVSFVTKNLFYFEIINRSDQAIKRVERKFRRDYFADFGTIVNMNHYSVAEREIRICKNTECESIKRRESSKSKKKEDQQKTNYKGLKMSEILKLSFFCGVKKKEKRFSLFKEKMEEFEKYLEVGSLFNLYKNFDFLKNVVLSEEQVTVFRTGLCLKFDEAPYSEENFDEDIRKVVNYFKRNISNDEFGIIDSKIVEFLKSNINNQLSSNDHAMINNK